MMIDSTRLLPKVTDENRFFWTSGKDGQLRFMRCNSCKTYIHPFAPVCRECLSEDVGISVVSGRGHIQSFTINRHSWNPAVEVPYAIAVVELEEQKGLRLTTNIITSPVEDIAIGQKVRVKFQECPGGIFMPLFELAE